MSIAGYTYPIIAQTLKNRCAKCNGKSTCYASHNDMGILGSLIWFLAVPAVIASGKGKQHADGLTRTEKRQKKEIEEAQHKRDLAKIAADEAEHLNRQLRAAGKNELVL